MKALRSAPFLPLASALQVFILSVWEAAAAGAGAASAGFFDKQPFMKLFRSSPLRLWVLASALQVFIFSCCAVNANEDVVATVRMAPTRMAIFFMVWTPSRLKIQGGPSRFRYTPPAVQVYQAILKAEQDRQDDTLQEWRPAGGSPPMM